MKNHAQDKHKTSSNSKKTQYEKKEYEKIDVLYKKQSKTQINAKKWKPLPVRKAIDWDLNADLRQNKTAIGGFILSVAWFFHIKKGLDFRPSPSIFVCLYAFGFLFLSNRPFYKADF